MKSKKQLFTLIATILAGLAAIIFLALKPVELSAGGVSEGIAGLDVVLGEEGVAGFNIVGLLALVLPLVVAVLLLLTVLGKFNKDLTVVYVVLLAVAGVAVFLAGPLMPFTDMYSQIMEAMDISCGVSFMGILAALCNLGGAALLAVNKWVIKE